MRAGRRSWSNARPGRTLRQHTTFCGPLPMQLRFVSQDNQHAFACAEFHRCLNEVNSTACRIGPRVDEPCIPVRQNSAKRVSATSRKFRLLGTDARQGFVARKQQPAFGSWHHLKAPTCPSCIGSAQANQFRFSGHHKNGHLNIHLIHPDQARCQPRK